MPQEEVSDQEVGLRIAQLRESAGLKQSELAEKITWSQAVLSRVESGEREVSPDELSTILAAIGTSGAQHLSTVLGRDWQLISRPPLDHPDQDTLWNAEQVCRQLRDLKEQPEIRHSFERRVAEYLDELQQLARLILKREHDIAFIGSLGVGKSTAICKLTSLEVAHADAGPPIPVLETGAGGVTICGVYLRTGPNYGLAIEPCTEDEIRNYAMDFAEHILITTLDEMSESDETENSTKGISKEIERAIRNMAHLRVRREKAPDGKTIRSDEAKELARRIASVREYAVEVLARMELHRRDRRDIWYDRSVGKAPLDWLKEIFEEVNNGRHPDFCLPRRIEVFVPQPLLRDSGLDLTLIDTKGIDRVATRADLERHFYEPHTLTLLCSGFNDAPGTAAHLLLERAKEAGVQTLGLNTILLVLPHPDQALAVKDEAGVRVETVQEGYELKGEQVAMALEPLGQGRLTVGFFNAFGDNPAALRTLILDSLERIRTNFRDRLRGATADSVTLLQNFEKEQTREVQRSASRMIRTWIAQHSSIIPINVSVQESLISQLQTAYASTIRASIRREGEWHNLSYGHHLGYGGRRLAVLALEPQVNGFKAATELLEGNPEYKEASNLIQQARRVLDSAFEDLLKKAQIMGQTIFKEALKSDPTFWVDCEKEWGQGPGYRNRVAKRNQGWFSAEARQDLQEQLQDFITREWAEALDRVSSLLEADEPA